MSKKNMIIECSECKGTGLYVGLAERNGAAVVCYRCQGKGYVDFEYNEFFGRKKRDDVIRVYETGYGYVISATDATLEKHGVDIKFSKAGCTYEDWLSGSGDPSNPIKELYCPFIWNNTGMGNEPLKRCKEGCEYGRRISDCKFFNQKEECWKEYLNKEKYE